VILALSTATRSQDGEPLEATPPDFKVAFIGDAGDPESEFTGTRAVLELIRDEAAALVLHQGDMGYANPAGWVAAVDEIFGVDFPYLFCPGNHDGPDWVEHYRPFLERKVARLNEIEGRDVCTGDLGEGYPQGVGMRATCNYRGLHFILSDIGLWPGGTAIPLFEEFRAETLRFTEEHFAASPAVWRVSSWHAAGAAMSIAPSIPIGVGWETYELAKDYGAIVATGHSHTYSRTRSVIDFEEYRVNPVWPDGGLVHVGRGSTFAFVCGLGGNGIHTHSRCLGEELVGPCEVWASRYTDTYGALFIVFHVDGDPRRARGYFKNIDGEIIDAFDLVSENGLDQGPLFTRGDANEDGRLDVSDAVAILNGLFGARPIRCADAADSNDDGATDISDGIHLLQGLFLGGPSPASPYPRPGIDYTGDLLGCGE